MAEHVAAHPWVSGSTAVGARVSSPAYQAYQLLHVAFTIAPIVAGLDKFFHYLANWDEYLAPVVMRTIGQTTAHTFMMAVGAIEVVAGLIVLFMPRIGGWIVGLWLCGIVLNVLAAGGFYDIALRDFGLALGAFALARLSEDVNP